MRAEHNSGFPRTWLMKRMRMRLVVGVDMTEKDLHF